MPTARRLAERLLRVREQAAVEAQRFERNVARSHSATPRGASDGTYGAVRVLEDLRAENPGERVGGHRVARLMRKNGVIGVTRRRKGKTTVRGAIEAHASDLVDRNFGVDGPDRLWVAGSVGDAYDNAMCESFFASLECELIDRRRFRTQAEARMAVFKYIEGFYNPRRRHSALDYLSPINYERMRLFAESA